MVFLLYGFAIFALWQASFALVIKGLLTLLLCGHAANLLGSLPPYLSLSQISLQAKKWILLEKNGDETSFENMRVLMEVGVFFLIEFAGPNAKTLRLVFFDQLSQDDYRMIKLL